jgi:hypothetical protein
MLKLNMNFFRKQNILGLMQKEKDEHMHHMNTSLLILKLILISNNSCNYFLQRRKIFQVCIRALKNFLVCELKGE